jgi:hypothetical protein
MFTRSHGLLKVKKIRDQSRQQKEQNMADACDFVHSSDLQRPIVPLNQVVWSADIFFFFFWYFLLKQKS